MPIPTASLQSSFDAALESVGGSEIAGLESGELIAAHDSFARLRREVDAALAALSGEIARRSSPDLGARGLARMQGFSSPERLVAAATGGSGAEAHRLIEVGGATLPQPSVLTALPAGDGDAESQDASMGDAVDSSVSATPRYPDLAKAVGEGRLSVDAAAAIVAMLDKTQPHAEPGVWRAAESLVVERGGVLPFADLRQLLRRVEARLCPARVEAEEEKLRDARHLYLSEDNDGMVTLNARLDPETGAPIKAAIDALVGDALRQRRDQDPASRDVRTAGQMRADALAVLCRHALGCEESGRTLPTTTVVVRMTLDDLRTGLGAAEIDGSSRPVSIATARRMAADARVIPLVLGGAGEVLDAGRARRLFSPIQRLALAERDGGCAWCGAPPSFTEAHHIRWWDRDSGPSDLSNGVLLCTGCHHRIHRDGWELEVRDGDVWFTPPTHVDPQRTPRIGGRKRFDVTDQDLSRAG